MVVNAESEAQTGANLRFQLRPIAIIKYNSATASFWKLSYGWHWCHSLAGTASDL